jgi:hypothetical protein
MIDSFIAFIHHAAVLSLEDFVMRSPGLVSKDSHPKPAKGIRIDCEIHILHTYTSGVEMEVPSVH